MTTNAKNQLQEIYHHKGWKLEWRGMFKYERTGMSGGWRSTIDHTMPDGRKLFGTGEANSCSQADITAVAEALAALPPELPDTDIMADAQPGDALIKLAAYITMADATPEERSKWLQDHETDPELAKLFDHLWDAGDPDVRQYGQRRGEKFKASVIEALIWRRFREHVLGTNAKNALARIFKLVGEDAETE